MHVINECGAWERQGLDVDYDKIINREDAHELVPTGEVEFVSGNHVSTYAARARGDTWALGPARRSASQRQGQARCRQAGRAVPVLQE